MKILFVDDDPEMSELYRINGRQQSVEIVGFETGGEALTYLDQPDANVGVVLLDLMLPTIDGLSIAEEIRRNERTHPERTPVKIAFVTAVDKNDAIVRIGERVHVENIYQKPADLRQIIADAKGWVDDNS